MMEIGLESYHFPYVHRQTLAGNLSGASDPPPATAPGRFRSSREPAFGNTSRRSPALTEVHRATTFTFGIFPCTVFNIDVDNLVWFTVLPTGTDQTESIFGSAARAADVVRILGEDAPTDLDAYATWAAHLGAEDNAACERVQRGLRGRHATPGPIIRSKENCLFEFQAYLTDQIPTYPSFRGHPQ